LVSISFGKTFLLEFLAFPGQARAAAQCPLLLSFFFLISLRFFIGILCWRFLSAFGGNYEFHRIACLLNDPGGIAVDKNMFRGESNYFKKSLCRCWKAAAQVSRSGLTHRVFNVELSRPFFTAC